MSDGTLFQPRIHLNSNLIATPPADFAQVKKLQQERNALAAGKKGSKTFDPASQRTDASSKASVTDVNYDTNLYERNGVDKYAGYNTSIAVTDEDENMDDADGDNGRRLVGQYTATKEQMDEFARGGAEEEDILLGREKQAQIQSRESDYQKRRYERSLAPLLADPFAADGQASGEVDGKTYREILAESELDKEEQRIHQIIAEKKAKGEDGIVEDEATLKQADVSHEESSGATTNGDVTAGRKRKNRWDTSTEEPSVNGAKQEKTTAKRSRWDSAPAPNGDTISKSNRWDQAPTLGGATPAATSGLDTPMHPSQAVPAAFGTDISARNASISDEELNQMLPGEAEGYKILEAPPGYAPIRAAARRVPAVPTPATATQGYGGGFMMQEPESAKSLGKQLPTEIPGVGDLQFFKAEDMNYFGKLVDGADENELSMEELRERKIMRLLLKVKNGTPPMRKTALRQLTDNARQFGAGPLFNQILPLLMEKTLEDQERHLLTKVVDRCLFKLDSLCRPWAKRLLVVIEPMLISSDFYERVEGREVRFWLSFTSSLLVLPSSPISLVFVLNLRCTARSMLTQV